MLNLINNFKLNNIIIYYVQHFILSFSFLEMKARGNVSQMILTLNGNIQIA